MRFLTLAALAMVASVDAKLYQFDVTGDNNFQIYISKAATPAPTQVQELKADIVYDAKSQLVDGSNAVVQTGWNTPARYTGLDLVEGDVLSVYVHNIAGTSTGTTIADGNPSAIVGRLRELTSNTARAFKAGGDDIPTDGRLWECAYRVELTGSAFTAYNPTRLSGLPSSDPLALEWAAASLNPSTKTWPLLSNQQGALGFSGAHEISKLGSGDIWTTTNIGGPPGSSAILTAMDITLGDLGDSTPYWIYDIDQHTNNLLAHHGWCRMRVPAPGNAPTSPPGAGGDPVFNGFQGQEFQFHGLPDEHFNLISSPQVQLNAHFVYLSAGKCDYDDTVCWTHPGTYMDVMGMSVGDSRIKVVAGTHEAGLRLWVNDNEVPRHTTIHSLSGNVTGSLTHTRDGHVIVQTDLINYEIINSDMFMNLRASIKSRELLTMGSKKHTVTDAVICHSNTETHNHQLVEQTVAKKYPITTQLHGLVGQTWRNVKVCGRDWMGTVQDYVVDSLFGSTYHYNYFQY